MSKLQLHRVLSLTVLAGVVGCGSTDADPPAPSPRGRDISWLLESERGDDPVVLTGETLGELRGRSPDELVLYRWDRTWLEVPVQVDERKTVSPGQIIAYVMGVPVRQITTYADPYGLTGSDPDPTIDDDDEVVFMVRDVGERAAPADEPLGVTAGSGVEISVTDPEAPANQAYVYAFSRAPTVRRSPLEPYGRYTFTLLAGRYPEAFQFQRGPNPEDTWFESAHYGRHFIDRWVSDGLKLRRGDSGEGDLIDQVDVGIGFGAQADCTHSAVGLSNGEGGFAVNKSGPVRSLRSYLGAISGPYTARTHVFYDAREDVFTDLRVHILGAPVIDRTDYSELAVGMTYRDARNPDGLLIDGVPDPFVEDTVTGWTWHVVAGAPGSVVTLGRVDADFDVVVRTTYEDAAPAEAPPCTGDDARYGASGIYLGSLPVCTDLGCNNSLRETRIFFYGDPDRGPDVAEALVRNLEVPLRVTVQPIRDR